MITGEQQRSKVRHERILDAALDVFARRGYRDAAVDDIAAASGTSKGGVYFHFPNKGSIFHAVMRRTAAVLMDRVQAAMDGVDDPIAKVDAALATALRLFAGHRTLARLFLVEALGAGPEFSAALMDVHADFARLIAAHLGEAVRAGAIAPLEAEQAGLVWFGALNEVVVRWVLTGRPGRLEEVYPSLRAMLLRSVGAPVSGRSDARLAPTTAHGSLPEDHVRRLLASGLARARQNAAPILVSLSRPVPCTDPLDLFAQADALGHDRLYWEHPADGVAVAGTGMAHTVESCRPIDAGRAWRALLERALVDSAVGSMGGPRLMGGFVFDPARERTPLWDGFPAGRLIVPIVSLVTDGAESTLTLNVVLTPEDDAGAEAARLLRWLETVYPAPPRPDRWQGSELHVRDVRSRRDWERIVAGAALSCAGDGRLEKVVLARAVRASTVGPFDTAAAAARLRRAYPAAYVFAVGRGVRSFLGATPERLVRLHGRTVEAACLAGSAPRGGTPEEDAFLGNALLASAKDRAEHAIVVRGVLEALDRPGIRLVVPSSPRLLRFRNVQHLYTPVEGRLDDETGIFDLLDRLHPTPAVGGFPKDDALSYIRAHEQLDRGWYAGPVGWVDRHGDGEFAVALRSALVTGADATLFAGCGIVASSNPADEYEETCLKLQPMLAALGGRSEL